MKIVKYWDLFEEQVGGMFLFLAVALVFGQIVARTVFNFGISGLYETATYCAIYSVFLTSSIAIKTNIHIRIDILSNIVGAKWAFLLEMIALAIVLFVSVALCYSGVILVQESVMLGDRTLGTVSMPLWSIQLILPVAGLLMALRAIERGIHLLRKGAANFKAEVNELEFL